MRSTGNCIRFEREKLASFLNSASIEVALSRLTWNGCFCVSANNRDLTLLLSFLLVNRFDSLAITAITRSFERSEDAVAGIKAICRFNERFETDFVECFVFCNRGKGLQVGDLFFGHFVVGSLFFNFIIMSEAKATFEVYSVIDLGEDKKPYFHRVGVAFKNSDNSLNVVLNSLPVNGTLNIRKRKETNAVSKSK